MRLIPAIVGGNQKKRHGIVLAKSTPAKKYGIQTGEAIITVNQKCPTFDGFESLYGRGQMVRLAYELKNEFKENLGFTVNIGISSNLLLSKVAGDFSKPDKVHTLFPDEIKDKMWQLPVSELFFVGRATTAKLKRLGIFTIGEYLFISRHMIFSTISIRKNY